MKLNELEINDKRNTLYSKLFARTHFDFMTIDVFNAIRKLRLIQISSVMVAIKNAIK